MSNNQKTFLLSPSSHKDTFLVRGHISAPYNNTDRTVALYMCNLVLAGATTGCERPALCLIPRCIFDQLPHSSHCCLSTLSLGRQMKSRTLLSCHLQLVIGSLGLCLHLHASILFSTGLFVDPACIFCTWDAKYKYVRCCSESLTFWTEDRCLQQHALLLRNWPYWLIYIF